MRESGSHLTLAMGRPKSKFLLHGAVMRLGPEHGPEQVQSVKVREDSIRDLIGPSPRKIERIKYKLINALS